MANQSPSDVLLMGSLNFNVWRLQEMVRPHLGKVAVEGKGSPAVPTPLFPQRSEALTGVLHWNLGTRHQENLPSRRKWCFTFLAYISMIYPAKNMGCTIPSGCYGSLC